MYQNEWAAIARMLIALQRDLRTTLFPREVGVVDGFMLEALLLRIYLWQLEGTPVTMSMLSRSLGVSRATCRRKLATLIEWEFIKREGQTYRIVVWMGEADQRRMLNRITAILIALQLISAQAWGDVFVEPSPGKRADDGRQWAQGERERKN